MNAIGLPYESGPDPWDSGGRVLIFSGCEVSRYGRLLRLSMACNRRVAYFSDPDALLKVVFFGPRV